MLYGNTLCAKLPHAEGMCLLYELLSWDQGSLVCTAVSHRDPNNPLRRDGQLAAIHAIEYACQASALHCALTSPGGAPQRAVLAAVHDLWLDCAYLDVLVAPLCISVWRELTLGPSAIYRFLVESMASSIARGRLTVAGGGAT
ncbi:MAG: hypothetical protein KAX64_04435 [Chromatiaceae bacterium]|nr:hypothetical protein [Chromatiaceae bacterium]